METESTTEKSPGIMIPFSEGSSRLISLPTELQVKFISHSHADDFENFVLSCKTVYEIARVSGAVQRHNELLKYRSWSCFSNKTPNGGLPDFGPESEAQIRYPLELINEIVKAPVIMDYLKYLDLDGAMDIGYFHDRYSTDILLRLRRAQLELRKSGGLKRLLETSPYWLEDDLDKLYELLVRDVSREFNEIFEAGGFSFGVDIDIHERYASLMAAQIGRSMRPLFTLLPEVTRLRPSQGFYSIGEWMNPSWPKEKFWKSIVDQSTIRPNASLAKLEIIEAPKDNAMETGILLESFGPLLLLPRVVKFDACGLKADETQDCGFDWPSYCDRNSSVEEIEVVSGAVSANSIGNFFKRLPNLRSLKWSQTGLDCGAAQVWDTGAFVAQLMASPAAETLRLISFNGCSPFPISAVGDLKGFKNLTRLEVNIDWLRGQPKWSMMDAASGVDEPEDTPQEPIRPLHDILPPSIERCTVVFDKGSAATPHEISLLLAGLSPQPGDLPRLQWIGTAVDQVETIFHEGLDVQEIFDSLPTLSWRRFQGRVCMH